MFFPRFDVLRDLILNIASVTCAFIDKQARPKSFKFSLFLSSFDRISWLQTLLSSLMNFLCSLILFYYVLQIFAVQFYGECWSGDPSKVKYDRWRAADKSKCPSGVGVAKINAVYRVLS